MSRSLSAPRPVSWVATLAVAVAIVFAGLVGLAPASSAATSTVSPGCSSLDGTLWGAGESVETNFLQRDRFSVTATDGSAFHVFSTPQLASSAVAAGGTYSVTIPSDGDYVFSFDPSTVDGTLLISCTSAAPVVSCPSPAPVYEQFAVATLTATATEPDDSVGASWPVSVDTSSLGSHTVDVTATDSYGAVTTVSCAYTVNAPAPQQTVGRWAGADRYATAATISAHTFAPGVPVAYVVAGGAFPDGLSAGAAAAHAGGPVLLTARDALPPATATELDRLNPGRIVVLGGPTVVTDNVLTQLASNTAGTVTRLFGPDRYTTAADTAQLAFTGLAHTVVIANGENYPDALAAVPLAAANNAPLLLVQHDSVPAAVTTALDQLQPQQILIIGGPASVTDTVAATLATHATVTRIAGTDRYATADAVATHLPASTGALIASGQAFPDALAGGAAAAHLRQPLLLAPTTCLRQPTLDHLHGTTDIHLLGGTAALTNDVQKLTACP